MWIFAIALAALTAAAPLGAQTVHADSLAAPVDTVLSARPDALAQVTALEEKRRQAMVSADVKTLATIMAPDATYVHSTGIMQNRDELLRLLANKTIRYLSFEVERTAYRVYDGTVVGTGVQTIKVVQGSQARTIRSRYTVVYAERDGAEQLIAYQSTLVPETTPAPKK